MFAVFKIFRHVYVSSKFRRST